MNLDEAVIVALGANLAGPAGPPIAALEAALSRFPAAGLRVTARSGWWRSMAWPDPAQPEYLNGVVLVETALEARAVLAALHDIEAGFGRERRRVNAARPLDLDLVAYGRLIVDEPGFSTPHPRAAERLFVMGPLAEIAPDWRHPSSGLSARELAVQASVGLDACPVAEQATGQTAEPPA